MTLNAEPPYSENCEQIWECVHPTCRNVDDIAFSPDGRIIASYSRESLDYIKLWDIASGKEVCTINWSLKEQLPGYHGGNLYTWLDCKPLFFSPDGKFLTHYGYVYSLASGKVVDVRGITLPLKKDSWQPRRTIAVSRDLLLAVSVVDTSTSTLKLWETSTGVDRHTFYFNEEVRDIYVNKFSPDGKIFASLIRFVNSERLCEDKIKLWQVETGKELYSILLPEVVPNTGWDSILAFSSDSSILATNCGDSLREVIVLLETATGMELCRLEGLEKKNLFRTNKFTALAISPDNQLLASGDSRGVITLWQLSKGWLQPLKARKIRTLVSSESCEPVKTLEFSPDGETLASGLGDNDSGITLWNVKNGKKHKTFSGHPITRNKIFSDNSIIERDFLATSPDGKIVACLDSTIKLWDTTSGGFLRSIERCGVYKIVFSQNSKFLIGVQYNIGFNDQRPQNIITWEVATGRKIHEINYSRQKDRHFVYVSQYGDLAAIFNHESLLLKVLQVNTGKTLCAIKSGKQHVLQIIFSHDLRLMAIRHSISEFTIWEITTGNLIRTIHTDNIEGDTDLPYPDPVLFSPNGKLLAITSIRNITLWQVSSGEKIHTIDRYHQGWGRCMAFSPSGKTLAFSITKTINDNKAPLILWDVETGNETYILDPSYSNYKIASLDFGANGQVLVIGYLNGTIKVWQQNKALVYS